VTNWLSDSWQLTNAWAACVVHGMNECRPGSLTSEPDWKKQVCFEIGFGGRDATMNCEEGAW
jgi:hypothetical protein